MASRKPKVAHAGPSHLPDDDPLSRAQGLLPADVLRDAEALPDSLSAILQTLDGKVSSVEVCRSLLACLPEAPAPLANALVDIAATADGSGLANAYHNPVHSRDVGVIYANLARLDVLLATGTPFPDAAHFLAGCCAAFGHDIGHDGDAQGEPFRLECIAADTVAALMVRHGVDRRVVERVRCVILATDVHGGYRALDASGRQPPSAAEGCPAELGLLMDKNTRAMACLLRDADVMQSAGLTPEDHDRQTARLEAERGIPKHSMGVRGADFFLKDLIRGRFLSDPGRLFQPRLDRLLELNERRARQGAEANGLAAFDG